MEGKKRRGEKKRVGGRGGGGRRERGEEGAEKEGEEKKGEKEGRKRGNGEQRKQMKWLCFEKNMETMLTVHSVKMSRASNVVCFAKAQRT